MLLLLLSPALNSCTPVIKIPSDISNNCSLRPDSTSDCPEHATLFIHGLNNTPAVFNDLVDSDSFENHPAFFLTLSGHGVDKGKPLPGTWIAELQCALNKIHTECPRTEISIVAYSLGGLVTLGHLKYSENIRYSKILLIAPPISLRMSEVPLRLILPLKVFGAALPSLAPEAIRAHTSTPLGFYSSLLELKDDLVISFPEEKADSLSICVALAENDMLVDDSGVRRWLYQNNFKRLKLISLSADQAPYGHLLLEKESYLPLEWKNVTAAFYQCLSEDEPN